MQDKNYTTLKTIAFTIVLSLSFVLYPQAKEKSSDEKGKNNKKSHEEAFIFDSCGKDSAGKCGKEKKNPFTDYSKSLK